MNTIPNCQSLEVINSPAESSKRNLMSDLRYYDNPNNLVAAVMEDIQVTLTWNHGGLSHFHHGWLRENCPSPESPHPSSMERLIQPSDISLTIKPEQVELSGDGFLVVAWPLLDGKTEQHKSTFHPGWLQSHCYSSDKRSPPSHTFKDKPKAEAIYEWNDIMECDSALLECLTKLAGQTAPLRLLIHPTPA
ncbi:gamma-butyrobetaine hydroxylase-like domain-containing protein [Pseudomonas sp. UV AK001]|uniref:gamma-butyrobetaine hydroxylase-like domain-containing protein n=1 Tax=Pseudomonas sp. UV AK001 TaxID=3384791 RepID=UPI0038D38BE6